MEFIEEVVSFSRTKNRLPPVSKETQEAMEHNKRLCLAAKETGEDRSDEEPEEKSERTGYEIAPHLLLEIQKNKLGELFKAGKIDVDELSYSLEKLKIDFESKGPKGASNFSANKEFVLRNLDKCAGIRPHQRKALKSLIESNQNISLIVCPTGSGKTGIATLAPYALGCTKVLVITPSLEIARQIGVAFNGEKRKNKKKPNFFEQIGLVTEANSRHFLVPAMIIEKSLEFSKYNANLAPLLVINAQKFTKNSKLKLEQFDKDAYDLVIVDEAHHYPAPTWTKIMDYFNGRKLFLTATPFNRNSKTEKNLIVSKESVCYVYTQKEAEKDGIIRPTKYISVESKEDEESFSDYAKVVVKEIIKRLKEHDKQDPNVVHKAMIITLTKEEAKECESYINNAFKSTTFKAAAYVEGVPMKVLDDFEETDSVRIMVVCKRLLEGFDHRPVSVTGILRNIQPSSKVLFTQFIGRCVRKTDPQDPITAYVIGHSAYPALQNLFDNREELADVDPDDEDAEYQTQDEPEKLSTEDTGL